jgi:hypothetical protein
LIDYIEMLRKTLSDLTGRNEQQPVGAFEKDLGRA